QYASIAFRHIRLRLRPTRLPYTPLFRSVTLNDGEIATWRLSAVDSTFGQALVVAITPQTERVSIRYATSPQAEALQWLTPQQTRSEEHTSELQSREKLVCRPLPEKKTET